MAGSLQREILRQKLVGVCERFSVRGWVGPKFTTPEETVAYYQQWGLVVPSQWELWLEQPGVPNSYDPRQTGEPIRAAVRLDDEDLQRMDTMAIARKLAVAVAGRAAHEALEWARMGGRPVLDPHADVATLKRVVADVVEYLMNAASS